MTRRIHRQKKAPQARMNGGSAFLRADRRFDELIRRSNIDPALMQQLCSTFLPKEKEPRKRGSLKPALT